MLNQLIKHTKALVRASLITACVPLLALVYGGPVVADEVDVVDVSIEALGEERFRVNVALLHEDTGWEHYANKWEVLDESGTLLGTRELLHPHVNEQPFTRSLTLTIPRTVRVITLKGYDLVHEDGGATMTIDVPHP